MTRFSKVLNLVVLGLGLRVAQAQSIALTHITIAPKVVDAESAACSKFVGEFYIWYLAHGKNADPLRAALKSKKANFSGELVKALNEDYKAAAKSPGEIVGLDFDPVLNSQDPWEKYVPGKVAKKGNHYLVEVFGVNNGKRSPEADVIPKLQKVGSKWVFTNFLYKHAGKTDDLLSILKQLKAERKKGG